MMSDSTDKNIEKIIRLMQTDNSVDAPEDSIRWSKNLFRSKQKEPSTLEKIKAVLKIDLAPGKAVFGERSGAAEARQMLFEAGSRAVDLRISERKDGFEIRGQVLGDGFEKCEVSLGVYLSRANDLSEFRLTGVGAGTYTLILSSGKEAIELEGLEIS